MLQTELAFWPAATARTCSGTTGTPVIARVQRVLDRPTTAAPAPSTLPAPAPVTPTSTSTWARSTPQRGHRAREAVTDGDPQHLAPRNRAADVTGLLAFTHVAAHHARVATSNALFHTRGKVSTTIQWVTFTDPEVGRVGLTEGAARECWGDRILVAEFDYSSLDRAITAGEPYGFAIRA